MDYDTSYLECPPTDPCDGCRRPLEPGEGVDPSAVYGGGLYCDDCADRLLAHCESDFCANLCLHTERTDDRGVHLCPACMEVERSDASGVDDYGRRPGYWLRERPGFGSSY